MGTASASIMMGFHESGISFAPYKQPNTEAHAGDGHLDLTSIPY
jgi:hypothetical protein